MKIILVIVHVLILPALALAMPQKVTTEQLNVVVYSSEYEMRKSMEESLEANNVAVGAIEGKNGLLEVYFWENRTKKNKVAGAPAVYLNITGLIEKATLQPLHYVDRANMFELAIHPDFLEQTSFVIQKRMNDPEQGDYAWMGVFNLKKSANHSAQEDRQGTRVFEHSEEAVH